ncbi:MAG TPA: hypothetical protein VLA34_07610, partial [Candidatus Krumholzibacterium sp.]|nr:hypothetical protein [Candidatus Krumholzibacterium sp.]
MSRFNIITALAVATVLTAGAGVCAASDFSSKSQSEISIEGQTSIYIECINGSVTIIGEDREDLLLKVNKKVSAGSSEEA